MELEQALRQYLTGGGDREGHQSELIRFVRWCGRQRDIGSLTSDEVAEYAQFAAGSSTDGQRRLAPVREFLAFAHAGGYTVQNLSSLVRPPKGKSQSRQGSDGRAAPQEYTLTPEGLAQLRERLDVLREERRQTAEEIRKAAADKDVRENAPLEAARERQGHIDSRVRELERVLRSATPTGVPTAPAPTNRVAQGRRVVVRHIVSGVERSYMLVAPPEANPMNGRLSTTSPVGKALLNCVVGDEVSVPTPRGAETFRIVEIA